MKFWQTTPLNEMSKEQWEQLCDGCGRCCTVVFEDEDSGEKVQTNAACQLLNCKTCRCGDYPNRFTKVPDCTLITPELLANDKQRNDLPYTCAYRQLAEGRPLEPWHPLVSGSVTSVAEAGISMAGQLIPEQEFDFDEWFGD